MKRLLIAICLLTAAYSGYWALGRAGLTRALDAGEAQLRQTAQLSYKSRDTTGYPSRFDTSWHDLSLTQGVLRYTVPLVQVFALSYRPNSAILFAPGPHQIDFAGQSITIQTDDTRASLTLRPNTDLALDRLTAQSKAITLSLKDTQTLTVGSLLAALHRGSPPEAPLKAYLNADQLTLPGAAFDSITLDALIDLDTPLTLRSAPSRLAQLTLKDGRITAKGAHVALAGTLTVDGSGLFQGSLILTGDNWQQILTEATEGGLIEFDIAQTWQRLGETLSGPGALNLTLPVQNGRLFLGPLPIATLPRLAPPRAPSL